MTSHRVERYATREGLVDPSDWPFYDNFARFLDPVTSHNRNQSVSLVQRGVQDLYCDHVGTKKKPKKNLTFSGVLKVVPERI